MEILPIKDGLNPSRVAVPADSAPVYAEEFLSELISSQRHRHPDEDAEAIAARFAAGEVVDDWGRRLFPTDVIQPGRFVNFYRRPAPERAVPGQLRLLFQDANLLIVDKPPFLSTLPRGQHITETALVRARRRFGIPQLSPAHRLDRLTRGVLMFTKHPEVRGIYQQLFDQRLPRKTYEALTAVPEDARFQPIQRYAGWQSWKQPTPETPWVLEHHMVKLRGRLATYLVDGAAPNAITHITGVRRIAGPPDSLVWQLVPQSGKTHQLRLALRTLGLPIVRDPLYEELSDAALFDPESVLPNPVFADEEDFTTPMELIAKELRFADPLTGNPRLFRSSFGF